jgi:hypothetical protein
MRFKKLAAILMLVIFLTSCALFMPQMPRTPQDKSTFFMSYYMAQLKDYNAKYVGYTTLLQETGVEPTELEATILSAKYEFLMVAWHPIAMYDSYVAAGEVPPAEIEAVITELMDILEAKIKEGQ